MKFLSWLPTMAVVMTTTLLIQQPAVMVNGFPSPRLISNATKSRLMMPLRVDHALGLVPKDSDGDKAPAPRGVALNTFVGGLTFAGGAMGFATKGSKASLIAGSTFGGMLLISALLISKQKGRSGNVMGSVVSALLTFVMGKKFLASKKFMPAGLIASLGTIAVIYNTIEAFFTRQAATPKAPKEEKEE